MDGVCPKCGSKSINLNIENPNANMMQQYILSPPIICSKCDYKHYTENRISLEEWSRNRDDIIDDITNE